MDDKLESQAPFVQRVYNPIHRQNRYPVDSIVCFVTTYDPQIEICPVDTLKSTH